jgi:flagellar biosynthesis protein FliQ
MDSHTAVDLGRQALLQCLMIAGPILLVVLLVGLLMSVLQTVTNVHDYSVAFIPKLVAVVIALALGLPWMMGKLADYSQSALSQVPAVSRVDR